MWQYEGLFPSSKFHTFRNVRTRCAMICICLFFMGRLRAHIKKCDKCFSSYPELVYWSGWFKWVHSIRFSVEQLKDVCLDWLSMELCMVCRAKLLFYTSHLSNISKWPDLICLEHICSYLERTKRNLQSWTHWWCSEYLCSFKGPMSQLAGPLCWWSMLRQMFSWSSTLLCW